MYEYHLYQQHSERNISSEVEVTLADMEMVQATMAAQAAVTVDTAATEEAATYAETTVS